MKVVLISTYELGRQPFGLASPAAWLRDAGAEVTCIDLSVQELDPAAVAAADLIAFYVPMHTATRLAARAICGVREHNAHAHLCFYGLYAPVNEKYLRGLGADTILGGEFEEGLLELVRSLDAGGNGHQTLPVISLAKQSFRVPDRSGLPQLDRYARLEIAPGVQRTVGYTEATRGCKHLCRHCPVVPVYKGNFRVVQRQVVLEDIRRQVAVGAEHITFGDPDFFNGPTHAVKVVEALHEEFPALTYDVTIKVEHLAKQRRLLPVLRDTGCLFVTSAVESMDPRILEIFDKHHTREEFVQVVEDSRRIGLLLNPTFVTFTPWTTRRGYLELLEILHELELIDNVAPVQYGIRLLIPDGSRLLELPETREIVGELDPQGLVYPWKHPDPGMDELHENVMQAVQEGQAGDESRRQIFARVWRLALEAQDEAVLAGLASAELDLPPPRATVPYLTEPWYC